MSGAPSALVAACAAGWAGARVSQYTLHHEHPDAAAHQRRRAQARRRLSSVALVVSEHLNVEVAEVIGETPIR